MSRAARRLLRFIIVPLAASAALAAVTAQERRAEAPRALTSADYARAEKFLAPALSPLVVGGVVTPNWLPDERFWYLSTTTAGTEFILVDPITRMREPAFNHVKLAAALSAATGATYQPRQLPFQSITLSEDGGSVSFDLENRRWKCRVDGDKCEPTGPAAGRGGGGREPVAGAAGGRNDRGVAPAFSSDGKPLSVSPDGTRAVFIRGWNLWLRDMTTGAEKALTTDGETHFGYATDNAGWRRSDRAVVLWSPDSRKVATFQQDEREVGEMTLVSTPVDPVTHPARLVWKFPLPGDRAVAMLHRVVIDVDAGRVVRLQMPPDHHRATLGDDFSTRDMAWSPDSARLAFISTSRDHRQAVLRVADTASGAVRVVMDETVATQYESRVGCQVLWAANEVLWYSERDNWGHLYLYDLANGMLKRQVTSGEGPVMQILRLDEKSRTVWFVAQGREPGEDPYFRHVYRVGLDGKNHVSLTPDVGDHTVQLSPSGRYLVDTSSQPDVPPVVVFRDASGRILVRLEQADISRLLATGWKPPVPITVKARDGQTDLYGLLFRPTHFDPSKKYPVINHVYPGPQAGSTGSRSFAVARGDRQALAELGFVVVTIDGMGTPGRSKAFQDAYYGAMGRDNTIPDQIAGMTQLARKFPWIDLDRAGIWGHSGGGFATTTAMFRFPGFFKAGIAESGNHDQRLNEDDWGERYQGPLVRNADGTDNYEAEANQRFARDLRGKLLLVHGTMDTNVPPYQTLMVVDALVKANKDFELLMLPNADHGYGSASAYVMRRRWDFFVRWVMGAEPPAEHQMQGGGQRSCLASPAGPASPSRSPARPAARGPSPPGDG